MRWRKLGVVFRPDGGAEWARSHAQCPTPFQLENALYRVFCASRDSRNRSHVTSFDINLERPDRVADVATSPVLAPGPLGGFDDHGVYASSAVGVSDEVRLYTAGFSPGARAPLFYAAIGVAISRDRAATFQKRGSAPLMARSEHDPCLVTSPFVLNEDGRWRMWYASGYRWEERGASLRSHYNIKYAESADGIEWTPTGRVCIDHAAPGETNISRAWINRTGLDYEAWYSYTNAAGAYRVGYAVSPDGLAWERRDGEAGISVSPHGWDSEALAYPAVVTYGGADFMFYNGNSFGRDGVGIAVAERD